MKKVLFLDKSASVLHGYVDGYLHLYEQLYSDTGLFYEQEILEYYRQEAKKRNNEIIDLIQAKLSPDTIIAYHITKGVHIPWRSKDLWIKWTDDGETRTIIELEIQ